jgi:hypothetical protein
MRRLARYGFTAFALVSLAVGTSGLAFVITGLVYRGGERWIWFHGRLDGVPRIFTSRACTTTIADGRMEVEYVHAVDGRHEVAPKFDDTYFSHDGIYGMQRFGPPIVHRDGRTETYFEWRGVDFASDTRRGPKVYVYHWLAQVPLWPMVVLCMVGPTILEWRYRVGLARLFRARRGLCAVCGYDLRASSGRCPECGNAFGSAGPKSQAV